jgi:hypothetical protein
LGGAPRPASYLRRQDLKKCASSPHRREAMRRGLPLVYIAAVRRRDSSTPLEETCHRGEAVCYVYGDVEWAPELEGRCRPVTFYVDVREEKKALEVLLLYIARTRSLPWVAFNRDVLKIVGLCDAEPNACLTEEAVAKKVEAIKKQLTARRLEPPRSFTTEAAGDGAGQAAQPRRRMMQRHRKTRRLKPGRSRRRRQIEVDPRRSRRVCGLTRLCWSC